MLKISVVPVQETDEIETTIEARGDLLENVSELGLVVLKMYKGLASSNKDAAELFRFAVAEMFGDPDFWLQYLPDLSPDARMSSAIIINPMK